MFWNKSRVDVNGLALLALILVPRFVQAQITTQQASSILFFPTVIAAGVQDTLIQVTNTSNSMAHARCFYIGVSTGSLQVTDFAISLTRQQPTQWIVSVGRQPANPEQRCLRGTDSDCFEAGFDPGTDLASSSPAPVPAAAGFRGALVCVEVDSSGSPLGGNRLTGHASLVNADSASSGYAAIGAQGDFLAGSNGNVLGLGVEFEYEGCPQTYVINHLAEGAEDALLGSGSTVLTSISAISCSLDLVGGQATSVTLDFSITTELEQTFSATGVVDGLLNASLSAIDPVFGVGVLGADVARTEITASPGGAAIVGSESRIAPGGTPGSTAIELHRDLEEREDEIVLPDL